MAALVVEARTILSCEDVIARAVQFFSNEKWVPTTQSSRIATFQARAPISCLLVGLTIIGFLCFIVPGIILYIFVIRRAMQFQNLIVSASPISTGANVNITYPDHAANLVKRFVELLPNQWV